MGDKLDRSEFLEDEIANRRDAALLRALSTPHKRQAEMKVGKTKLESGVEENPKKRGRSPKATSRADG